MSCLLCCSKSDWCFIRKKLISFEKDNSDLAGHPVKNLDKGIEFSTGSLGMGLSIAVGLGIAFKEKRQIKYL